MLRQIKGSTPLETSSLTGFTLVELVLVTVILAILVPSTFQILEGISRNSIHMEKRVQAYWIAKGVMEEVLLKRFDENPNCVSPSCSGTLGLDAGEALPETNIDDIDDYHGSTRFIDVMNTASTADDYRALVTVDYVVFSGSGPPAVPTHSTAQTNMKRVRVDVRDSSNNVWASVKTLVGGGGAIF